MGITRVNHSLSLAGNTAGVLALLSSGNVVFAGGNNITLSQNANTVTISAANTIAQTNQTIGLYGVGNTTQNSSTTLDARTLSFNGLGAATVGFSNGSVQLSVPTQTVESQSVGMSNIGNTSGTTGIASGGQIRFLFAGGNNVTLSQSINGASGTITISAFTQTIQTQNLCDLTLAGNSTSAGVGYILVSSGTLTLAGGNNITLSQNGNAITVSAFTQTVQTQNLADVTIAGNSTSAGAGYILVSSGTLTLAGGNNVTLSQNGNAITISGPTTVAQTNQTVGLYGLGNTTQNSSTTLDARTLSFNGLGMITVGYSNGSIQLSATQTAQTQNLHDLTLAGNSTSAGAGYINISSGTMTLAGGNNITLSQNGNAITISAFTQTVQTQNLIDLTIGGNSTSAGAGYILASSGTLTLAGGNNITLSQNGNAVTISAFTQTVQTQNLVDITLAGNSTSAGAGYILGSSGTITLAGGNNVTLSQNGNAITISAGGGAQTVQTQNLIDVTIAGNSTSAGAGYILASSGTLTLAGGNNITLSQNGNAITISGANAGAGGAIAIAGTNTAGNASTFNNISTLIFSNSNNLSFTVSSGTVYGSASQSVQTQNLFNVTLGGNTAGAMAQVSSGTMTLAGGNNITLSQNGNAITISANAATVNAWELNAGGGQIASMGQAASAIMQGGMSIIPMNMPAYLNADNIRLLASRAATSASWALTISIVVYTNNASTLSLASTASRGINITGNANNATSYSGLRGYDINTIGGGANGAIQGNVLNFTPGDYWIGILLSTTNQGLTIVGGASVGGGLAYQGSLGVASATSANFQPFGPAVYASGGTGSLSLTTVPSSIGMSQLSQRAGGLGLVPYCQFLAFDGLLN